MKQPKQLYRVIFKYSMWDKSRTSKVVPAVNSIDATLKIADIYGHEVQIIKVFLNEDTYNPLVRKM